MMITDANEEEEYYSLIKRAFDALAPVYDLIAIPLAGLREKVVSFTGAADGARILDVATGTGEQAFAFARHGYEVIGIDLSEAMLNKAHRKNKYGNVKLEVADATTLRFPSNSFDVVCASFALHDMPLSIREKVLKEMVRVTKPKGTIVIVDYGLPRNPVVRALIYHLITLYEGEYYKQFIASDLEALLGKTGIEIEAKLSALLGAGRIVKGSRMV
jgi:demethylmenaquinone methyltransferase/2-methoxy-6-polyprenyl-1,4-benzoquinol methylase